MNNSFYVKNNVLSGLLKLFITIILPFLIRTTMIYTLGKEYLGLNSLFTSILSVLNLAELGFSNAIIFCMYEPVAEKNTDKICALLEFYRKIYFIIGLVIFVMGILILPFIKYIIKGTWPNDINIYLLFLIYLCNVCISYWFFAYKSALLNVLKRIDIVNIVQILIYTLQYLIQIFILIVWKNYYAYIVITPICTLIINIQISKQSEKLFPIYKCKGCIDECDKRKIIYSVKNILLYRISEITRNSLDTIVISAFIGLGMVAIYNNYYYIFTAIYGILVTINQGMQAVVGNNLVEKNVCRNYEDMKQYHFNIMWIVSWFTVCLICLYQPFMRIWVGSEMMLSMFNVVLLGLYFYILNMNNIRNLYYDGKGLWGEGRWTYICEILGNLFLNIVLGKVFGVTGIIVATIITILVFSGICRTNILFKYYFRCSVKEFWIFNFKNIGITIVALTITYLICNHLIIENLVIDLMLKLIVCIIIPNFILWCFYRKNKMFLDFKMKNIVKFKL